MTVSESGGGRAPGGSSLNCPSNAGAAGTVYDAWLLQLVICNGNQSSVTSTQIYETPSFPVWNTFVMEGRSRGVSPIQNLRMKVHSAHHFRQGAVFVYGSASLGYGDVVMETNSNDGLIQLEDARLQVYGRLQMQSAEVRLSGAALEVFHWRAEESLQSGFGSIDSSALTLTAGANITHTGFLKLTNQNQLNISGAGSLIYADKLLLQNVLRIDVSRGRGACEAEAYGATGHGLSGGFRWRRGRRSELPTHCPSQSKCKIDPLTPPPVSLADSPHVFIGRRSQLSCDVDTCPLGVIPNFADCNDFSPFTLHVRMPAWWPPPRGLTGFLLGCSADLSRGGGAHWRASGGQSGACQRARHSPRL